MLRSLVGSEMCIRDRSTGDRVLQHMTALTRQRYLTRQLAANSSHIELRNHPEHGDGLFATEHCAKGTLLLSDVASSWKPESTHALTRNCLQCGSFLGTPEQQLALLAGDDPLGVGALPDLLGASIPLPGDGEKMCCGLGCERAWHVDGITWEGDDSDLVTMAAQLIHRVTEDGDAVLAAFHSCSWSEIGRHPGLAERSFELARGMCGGLQEGKWSQALGAVARNAIEVKIPNPLVYYMMRVQEGASVDQPTLERISEMVNRGQLKAAEAIQRGQKRPREKGGGCVDEGDEEEEEDSDDDDSSESSESSGEGAQDESLMFSWELAGNRNFECSSDLFPAHSGAALFGLLSKVNHSCLPNCDHFHTQNNTVKLVARPVSYTHLTLPTKRIV
eukprot:TRINITY_DN54891_c0_g2_i1.p1 TRINITY_DN54891_c0_g2~~TRINITY_DN54891_c0_g2_i1.p1  ORF type:complete len:437 (+),score=87.92 TRINITY_DN54891_c0_g2_i1:143-1312(+)